MCGLCGVWRGKAHWSARSQNPRAFGAVAEPSAFMRERIEQVSALNRIAQPLGVTVRDWEGAQWIIDSPHGGSEIVASVAAVWPAIERLSRRKIDPLSANFPNTAPVATAGRER